MPTEIYESKIIYTIDGDEVFLSPLKILYLKQVMDKFDGMKDAHSDIDVISVLAQCCLVAMKQYMPSIKTIDQLEDTFDLDAIYTMLDVGAGIKIKKEDYEKPVVEKSSEEGGTWDTLDLAKLESELFLLGIWKDYKELEESLSMPELTATLNAKREQDYSEKRFSAALQGVDLDAQNPQKEVDPWEAMKARVFSGGATSDPNDVLSLQGTRAQQVGFGIGMGLDYEDQR